MTDPTPPRDATSVDRVDHRADGRAARQRAPRRAAAEWDASVRQAPALDRLRAQEAVRDQDLLPVRYARMASSPWAYLRGAAAVMAADLATRPHSGLMVQMCGDAHILNFGLWASPERQLLFDARDFDETLPGPFEWDLKRLATSVFVLADSVGLSVGVAEHAAGAAADGYRQAMHRYAAMGELDVWYDRITAADALEPIVTAAAVEADRAGARLRKVARKRSQEGAVGKVTAVVDGRRRITDEPGKRWHPTVDEADAVRVFEQVVTTYLTSVPPHLVRLLARYRQADAVRQVVGVGSVGMRVFLLLLEGESGRQPLLFQVKQATESVYEPFVAPSAFPNHGQRVAVGQRLMQSASDMFLGHVRVEGLDFYVRQFRDMKIIPDAPTIAPYLADFARACGQALAKSHARSGEPTAIDAYIGKGGAFRAGIVAYGRAYAAQTVTDHADLVTAIAAGDVEATDQGW